MRKRSHNNPVSKEEPAYGRYETEYAQRERERGTKNVYINNMGNSYKMTTTFTKGYKVTLYSDIELRYAGRRCDEPGFLTTQQHSDYRCRQLEPSRSRLAQKVCASRPSHKASFAASVAATCSASVVEVAVHS